MLLLFLIPTTYPREKASSRVWLAPFLIFEIAIGRLFAAMEAAT
jgi:hypothetical protein